MLIMDWNKRMLILLSQENRLNILVSAQIERKKIHFGSTIDVLNCPPFPSAATFTLPTSLSSTLFIIRNLAFKVGGIKQSLSSIQTKRAARVASLFAGIVSLGMPFSSPKSNERFFTKPRSSLDSKSLSEDDVLGRLASHPTNILVNKERNLGARIQLLRIGHYRIAPTGFPYSANSSFAILAKSTKSIWVFAEGIPSQVAIPDSLCGENALFLPPKSAVALVMAEENTSKKFFVMPAEAKLKPRCPTERISL
jgi:hypothetical protein